MTTDPHHSPQGSNQNGSELWEIIAALVRIMLPIGVIVLFVPGTCTRNTTTDPSGASPPPMEDHRGTNRNDYHSTATTDRIKEEKR